MQTQTTNGSAPLTARDIEIVLVRLCGSPLFPDEGLKFGDPTAAVRGILNCWTFNEEVAALARREECNLILSHEALYIPYGVTEGSALGEGSNRHLTWPANYRRTKALVENDLHFLRFHGHADQIIVFEAFAAQLGLSKVHAPGPLGYDSVYMSPERSVEEWIAIVKQQTGMNGLRTAIRDLSRPVTKIGLAWGGMGLFCNLSYPMKLIELGAELIIAGETDNYGFRFMVESGVDVIECSHELSENEGIAGLGELLRKELPAIKIVDYCNPCIWKCL